MTVPNEEPKSSPQSLSQRLLSLVALSAARVLIWARERQILSERKGKIILLATSFFLSAGNLAHSQITPSADTYVNMAEPTTNFGAATMLAVNSSSETSFIQFNLGSIPSGYSGSNVSQATLKLFVNSVTTTGTFNVAYVTSNWSESTITAKTMPSVGNSISNSVPVGTARNYVLINVTSAVQAWLNGTQTNYGLALTANGQMEATFDSKENAATSQAPELDVVFVDNPNGTITGVTANGGSGLLASSINVSGAVNLGLTTSCGNAQVLQWQPTAWVCAPAATSTLAGITPGTAILVSNGGNSSELTVSVNSAQVPLLASANTFLTTQQFNGPVSLAATTGSTTGVLYLGSTPMLHNYYGSSTSNPNNTFVGGAGNFSLTTGAELVGVGFGAMGNVSTSFGSVAVGNNSLPRLTTGNYNAGVGIFAGQTLDFSAPITGSNNTFLGAGAGATMGDLNNATVIGSNAVVSQSNSLVLGCTVNNNGCTQGVNVGIGTTSPQQTLDVSGGNAIVRGPQNFTQAGQQAYFYVGDTNHYIEAQNGMGLIFEAYNDYNPLIIWDGVEGINGGAVSIGSTAPESATAFQIQQGLGRAVADGWDSYSSRRWKTNIHTLHGALDKVERLRGVSYDSKSNGKHEIGVIAEEVGAVVPEVVTWEKNGKDASSVDYERLTALLIESSREQKKLMQQQQRQIKLQQAQIKAAQGAANIRRALLSQLASEMKNVQAALKADDRGARNHLATSSPPIVNPR